MSLIVGERKGAGVARRALQLAWMSFAWIAAAAPAATPDRPDPTAPSNPVDVRAYLEAFHRDPRLVMNSPLARRDEAGRILENEPGPFPESAVRDGAYVLARGPARESVCRASGDSCRTARRRGWAAVDEKNRPEDFLYSADVIRRLDQMEAKRLRAFATPEPPWSDSFWPVARGMIGRRYADRAYPDSPDWSLNWSYVQSNPSPPISLLSPAEKYDLLVGDGSRSLTNYAWSSGRSYLAQFGHVPGWVGLCHGWAPASILFPNPQQTVVATSFAGLDVPFYPSDVKALAATLWGHAPPTVRKAGARCDRVRPKEDAVGRVVDPECWDVNPATWHISVVNQLGLAKRAFVIDATYDYQVWNYPAYAYQYRYFNPQTMHVGESLSEATIPIRSYTIDKFSAYRSPQAVSVVGVAMDVTYSIEVQPDVEPIEENLHRTVRYVYDLELDATGNLIGGEWFTNFHPDFIWNMPPGTRALSRVERRQPLPPWNGGRPTPEMRSAAIQAAASGQPLAVIVEGLILRGRLAPPLDQPPVDPPQPISPIQP